MKNQNNTIAAFSALPFPNLYWMQHYINVTNPVIDLGEFFEKMSFRNRYLIGAANGLQMLSIPLLKGRNQRSSMQEVSISYAEKWQHNHWKSLEAAYMRTPFFEFYKDYIQLLYTQQFESLTDWNIESLKVVLRLLKLPEAISVSDTYLHAVNSSLDFRSIKPKEQLNHSPTSKYIQPFAHKIAFLPNLSILDLLFCEGPNSLKILKSKQNTHTFESSQTDYK